MAGKKPSGQNVQAMIAAAKAGNLRKVRALLRAGVPARSSALMAAASEGHEEVFLELVKAGADVHATDSSGLSVLCYVVGEHSTLPMIQAVIASGIRPTDAMEEAFCIACAFAPLGVVKAMMEAGADVNAKPKSDSPFRGATPLILAVQYNRPAVVKELLKAGANPAALVPRGDAFREEHYKMTALELARSKRSTKIVKLLEGAGGQVAPKPKRAARPDTVADSWKRIGRWIKANAPGWNPLKKGATPKQIGKAEKELGVSLPAELQECYLAHDGSGSAQVFPCSCDISYYFYSLFEMVSDWKMMKELLDLGEFHDCQVESDKGVRKDHWNIGWLPFAGNGGGDTFCVDLAPAPGGKKGQVITMSHEGDKRRLLASSLREWLNSLADGLESGKYSYAGQDGIV